MTSAYNGAWHLSAQQLAAVSLWGAKMNTCAVCNCRLSGRGLTVRLHRLAGPEQQNAQKVEKQDFVVKQVLDLKDGDCRMMVSKPLTHGHPPKDCCTRTLCVCTKGWRLPWQNLGGLYRDRVDRWLPAPGGRAVRGNGEWPLMGMGFLCGVMKMF